MADEGGSNDEGGTKTYTEDEVKDLIAQEVKGLRANRDAALQDKRAAREQAEQLQSQLDGVQAKLAELEQARMGDDAGLDEEKLAEIRKKIRADVERDYAPLKDRLAKAEEQLGDRDAKIRTLTVDNVVKGRMGKAGVRSDRIEALFKQTSDRYDLSEDGEVILTGDMREIPLDKYLSGPLAQEFPEWYNGSGSSGGGASRTTTGGGGNRIVAADDPGGFMANVEKIASGEVEVR